MVTWPIPCCLLRLLEWHAPAGRRTVLRWDLVSGSYKDTTPTRWCRETASEPGRQITGEARSRYWRESDQARGRLAPPSSQYWRPTPIVAVPFFGSPGGDVRRSAGRWDQTVEFWL